MTFLRTLLLLLVLTAPRLFAVSVINYGAGLTLTTTNDTFLTIIPTAGNAGAGVTVSDANTVLQIMTYEGSLLDGMTPVVYGATVALRLGSNNFWVTLNPTDFGAQHIRNNAPQILPWEKLFFISQTDGKGNGDGISFGDQLLLARNSEAGVIYVVLNDDGTSHTTSDVLAATTLIISSPGGGFSPYSQAGSMASPINNNSVVSLAYTVNGTPSFLYMNTGSYNGGYVPTSGFDTGMRYPFQIADANGNVLSGPSVSQLIYGQPITLLTGDSSYFVTMNIPAPDSSGVVRNNVTSLTPSLEYPHAPVWEQLYFVSAYGYNSDLVYENDYVLVARNSLTSGSFITEYIKVADDGTVSTVSTDNMVGGTFFQIGLVS